MGTKEVKDFKGHSSEILSSQGNPPSERVPIAHLRAVVEFPLYEDDTITRPARHWTDFVYEEPGIAPGGRLGTCRRKCKTISAEVVPVAPQGVIK